MKIPGSVSDMIQQLRTATYIHKVMGDKIQRLEKQLAAKGVAKKEVKDAIS